MMMIIIMIMQLVISVSLDGQFLELWEGMGMCFVFVKHRLILNVFCTVNQL